MESYLRGAWIHYVANDTEIDSFVRGKNKELKAHKIVKDLEGVEAFDQKRLSFIKEEVWSDLCDFTHCGGKTIFSHFAGNEIRANYDEEWIAQALMSANSWALLSGLATVLLADRVDLGEEFLAKSRTLTTTATI